MLYNSFEDFSDAMTAEPKPMNPKVLPDAFERFKLRKYDDVTMKAFKKEMETAAPFYFLTEAPEASDAEECFSVDAQVRYVKAHSQAELVELLAANGLKPGQTRKRPEAKGTTNPYSPDYKGTEEQREKAISALIRSNATLATQLARAANRTITNQELKKVGA